MVCPLSICAHISKRCSAAGQQVAKAIIIIVITRQPSSERPHLVDEHDDNALLRQEGVEPEGPGSGVESTAHVWHSRPAHTGVQDVAVQLRIYLRLRHPNTDKHETHWLQRYTLRDSS